MYHSARDASINEAAKRLLVAFKVSWRQTEYDEPPLKIELYEESIAIVMRHLNDHRKTIPYDSDVSPQFPVNWSDLVVFYGKFGDGSIEACIGQDISRTMLSRVIPNGRWERAMHRSLDDVVIVPHNRVQDYHIVLSDPAKSFPVRLQDLDEVRRTNGQHLGKASKEELVGTKFRYEG